MQVHEFNSWPRILFGIGEEGGEPICRQAQSFRMERFLQILAIISLYLILGFPLETEHTGLTMPTAAFASGTLIEKKVTGAHPSSERMLTLDAERLRAVYRLLLAQYGPQHW